MSYRTMALMAASVVLASLVFTTQSDAKQKSWQVSNFRQGQTTQTGGTKGSVKGRAGHESSHVVQQGTAKSRSNIKTNARYGGMQFGGANNRPAQGTFKIVTPK